MQELVQTLVPELRQELMQELGQVGGPETGAFDSLLDHGPGGTQQVVETDQEVLLPRV